MNRYDALKHAVKAHAGEVDKCGQPYILHPIAVAEALEPLATVQAVPDQAYEDAVIVALLHDVLEDTDYELDADEFQLSQWSALFTITHRPEQTYAEYIDGICTSMIAPLVKLADLWHNLRPERLACLPTKERASLERRYLKARDRIWEALGYRWWPEAPEGKR
jgi:(p)ppGpp synthase/HD superfamily hydrolase